MSNYIDTDILLDDLLEGRCESDILQKVRQAIIDEVIGLDGIDIVRCKECKYFDYGENESCCWHQCTRHFGCYPSFNPDDFCSYGERSE